jgi:hypothetical protein
MKATQLRAKLAELNQRDEDSDVEISIGDAADGQRFQITDVVTDDNCGGEGPIVVIECEPSEVKG